MADRPQTMTPSEPTSNRYPDDTEPPTEPRRLSRRRFLPGAAGVVALGAAGAIGYELGGSNNSSLAASATKTATTPTAPAATPPAAGVEAFVTRPDLRPPVVNVTSISGTPGSATSPRFVALAPISALNDPRQQHGPMLIDRQGRLVWFDPQPGSTFDVQVQVYEGKPVLTWWQGTVVGSHGVGVGRIVDSNYHTIATVGSAEAPIDLHEFCLTSRGTALVTTYNAEQADLSSIGGPSEAEVWAGHALELDVKTGKVLFRWNSLDHVGVTESYKPLPAKDNKSPYDYFHINSLSELPDGHLLVSGRDTWALYKVHRRTGQVLWRLGGNRSDFAIGKGAGFSWQHHVRTPQTGTITVFDNGADTLNRSRGLVLSFDESKRRVALRRSLDHPAGFLAQTLGSVQLLDSGMAFVGWGSQSYMSSFDRDGRLMTDGQLPVSVRSYRAFAVDWVGHPGGRPALVARANPAGGFVIHASWNGATEIARWIVMAGSSSASLERVGMQQWSGFETPITVNAQGPAFQVIAEDISGRELGRSEIV